VDCVEAIYNLGLVNIQLKLVGDALQAFEKLHTILPTSAEVVYHIANLHQHSRDDLAAAAKWFNILLARTPTVSLTCYHSSQLYLCQQHNL
jgi:intraflagellar transport protein 88